MNRTTYINKISIERRIMKYFLCFLLVVSLLLSWIFCFLKFSVLDTKRLADIIAPDSYMEKSISQIKDKIRYECLYLDLPADEVEAAVDDGEIKRMIAGYTAGLIDALIYNKDLTEPSYPQDKFLTLVRGHLEKVQSSGSTVDINAAAQEISVYLTDIIDNNVSIISSEMFGALPKMDFLKKSVVFAGNIYLIFIIASVLFALILFFINKRKLLGWLYNFVSCMWISSSIVFVPVCVLKITDIPSKLSVSTPMLGVLIENAIYTLLNHLFYPSLILFFLSSLGLASCIFLTVKKELAIQRKAEILGYET
ncbi:MAG TPA: hypothetical protein DEQ02_03250 [Ruminococcaceae bacterium]|nr:hypothetical protein [Oscillospiraceae bacterium]